MKAIAKSKPQNEYDKQAEKFLTKTETNISLSFVGIEHSPWDKKNNRPRYIWSMSKGGRSISGNFWGSAVEKKFFGSKTAEYYEAMRSYDLLSCLSKYDPGTIDDFCSEFGYNTPETKISEILSTYEGVKKEYTDLLTLYNEQEMDLLREIQ